MARFGTATADGCTAKIVAVAVVVLLSGGVFAVLVTLYLIVAWLMGGL